MDASDFDEYKINWIIQISEEQNKINKARLREYISYVPAEIEDFIDFRSPQSGLQAGLWVKKIILKNSWENSESLLSNKRNLKLLHDFFIGLIWRRKWKIAARGLRDSITDQVPRFPFPSCLKTTIKMKNSLPFRLQQREENIKPRLMNL